MIRRVVDFALGNRLLVLAFALMLFAGGMVAFRDLPIEAYPDVADNYVEVITQWPGISAEQIERPSAFVFAVRPFRFKTHFRR